MKAWLILKEGPGAGLSYPLDPFQQSVVSVGRSSQCDIVVPDHRASRHHSDFRWNGRQWEVVDRGSTNGTYVNNTQVHKPHELHLGDRITIGETTMVLGDYGAQPTVPHGPLPAKEPVGAARGYAVQPGQPPLQPVAPAPSRARDQQPALTRRTERHTERRTIVFWLAQALVVAAVVCLAAGAFLPWFKVTGSLSRDMEPLIQGITDIVASIMPSEQGREDLLSVTQEISGRTGFGKFTLGIAVLSTVLLILDIFIRRKSMRTERMPSVVYLLTSLAAVAVMVSDLKGLYDLYDQVQSMTLLFGIRLEDVINAFGKFIELEVTLLPGLYLTATGLGFLLIGGIVRLAAAFLARVQPPVAA